MLNPYRFYREVALEYLGQKMFTDQQTDLYQREYRKLAKDYHQGRSINYSDSNRLIAYVLSFAPRHSIYWQKIVSSDIERDNQNRGVFEISDTACAFNSVGTGPGSELVGLLSSISRPEGPLTAYVGIMEVEEAWNPIQEIVKRKLREEEGIELALNACESFNDLYEDSELLGSYFLSEVARQHGLAVLLEDIVSTKGIHTCIFVDAPVLTIESGEESSSKILNQLLKQNRCEGIKKLWEQPLVRELELLPTLRSAHIDAGGDPVQCLPDDEPQVSLFKIYTA